MQGQNRYDSLDESIGSLMIQPSWLGSGRFSRPYLAGTMSDNRRRPDREWLHDSRSSQDSPGSIRLNGDGVRSHGDHGRCRRVE